MGARNQALQARRQMWGEGRTFGHANEMRRRARAAQFLRKHAARKRRAHSSEVARDVKRSTGMTRIDELMPTYRLRQVERLPVAASIADAWAAARGLDIYDVSYFRSLIWLRVLPERTVAWLRGRPEPLSREARIEEIVKPGSGFMLLHEDRGREVVVGSVGKFWQPKITWADLSPAGFTTFAEPGWGKLAWNLRVDPREGGAWVSCDLRVTCTDDASWRRFRRYFRLVVPFSRAIRRAALREIARKVGAATSPESAALPGDEILPEARFQRTHTIVVEAPPTAVWPWLAQIGGQRAGWYSVDLLDNGGKRSADRIIPELQHIAVGDIIPGRWKGTDGFAVLRAEPGHTLVLGSPEIRPEYRQNANVPAYVMSWAFVLAPIGDDATELQVRVRAAYDVGLKMAATRTIVGAAHEIMERVQLRNLKRRAEGPSRAHTH